MRLGTNDSPPWVTLMMWCSLNSPGVVSIPTLLIMLHGSMRSLMWWVPTFSLILQEGIRCTACRGDDLPHPRTADQWPVGLRRSGTKKTRKSHDSCDHIVHIPLPPWRLDNAEFQRVADDCFDLWFVNRDSGFAGLSSFVGTMYACAPTFLSTHIIIATTARQRLKLAPPILTCPPSSNCMSIWMLLTASLCLHTCLSVWLNGVGCKRTLFSSKPLPGLMSCLIQLRGSDDIDNMNRHCNPLNDSNKRCLLP